MAKIKMKAIVTVVAASLTMSMVAAYAAQGAQPTLIISSDLPLQGTAKDISDSTNMAIELYLKQVKYKAGKYTIKFKKYDDSTPTAAAWDPAKCAANALAHVANRNEVAVMGTFNSGCSKIIVPVLNQDPKGPMLMISNSNTSPGLTKAWDAGEPAKYYPTGKRNYARLSTTDDIQGPAAAQFALKELHVKSVYVLNDTQAYGQGVAAAFITEAKKIGITVLSSGASGEGWDVKQPTYEALMLKIKNLNPDMLYVAGVFENNGGQLIKDKVAVLGDNTKVKLMGPNGFTGYPDLNKMPEAEGMYLSFTGLTADQLPKVGAGAKFIALYKKTYKKAPVGSDSIYGVAALQVILEAIKKSNGTRKSVNAQVFSGKGITIPASLSVLGKTLHIDVKTGDVNIRDITIEVIKGGAETTLKAWPVK
ncbi:MAG TPA: branched-chain amino acid ABC transporter substrate-binding protein [Candidatus Nanopelagicaceae bacterium]